MGGGGGGGRVYMVKAILKKQKALKTIIYFYKWVT